MADTTSAGAMPVADHSHPSTATGHAGTAAPLTAARPEAFLYCPNPAALLRPEPVTVEIREPDEWGDTELFIGDDARGPVAVPCYRVTTRGDDMLHLTLAQLAALMVAAQTLCKPARAVRAAVGRG